MNNNKIISISLVVIILLGTGCKKFLKERSQDELTPQTAASLGELLAREGYPYVGTNTLSGDGYYLCNYLNVMDDDVQMLSTDAAVITYNKPYYTWSDNAFTEASVSPLAAGAKNPYQNIYNRIRGCNVVMDMLPDVSGTDAEKDQLKGEALALRAYYYFMLVNLYAWPYNDPAHDKNTSPGVPILIKGDISDAPIPRSTVKQVYDLMVSDIEQAASLLEKQKYLSTLYRISYRAAWLLASRIYQHMEQWDKVLVYTNKLIGEYPQITDLNTWKVPIAQSSQGIGNANFIDPTNVEMLFLFSGTRYGDMTCFNTGGSAYTTLIASQDLINQYETNDMRFGVWTSTTNFLPNFFLTRLSGQYMASKEYFNATAGRCFRMSEAYLNRAEALIRQLIKSGNATGLQSALDDLNYLRVRRFKLGASNVTVTLSAVNNDPQQALQFCLAERRRELCFEEFRWLDLRRNGMPQLVHTYNPNKTGQPQTLPLETYTLPQGSNRYVMKFPDNAMAVNPQLMQNP